MLRVKAVTCSPWTASSRTSMSMCRVTRRPRTRRARPIRKRSSTPIGIAVPTGCWGSSWARTARCSVREPTSFLEIASVAPPGDVLDTTGAGRLLLRRLVNRIAPGHVGGLVGAAGCCGRWPAASPDLGPTPGCATFRARRIWRGSRARAAVAGTCHRSAFILCVFELRPPNAIVSSNRASPRYPVAGLGCEFLYRSAFSSARGGLRFRYMGMRDHQKRTATIRDRCTVA